MTSNEGNGGIGGKTEVTADKYFMNGEGDQNGSNETNEKIIVGTGNDNNVEDMDVKPLSKCLSGHCEMKRFPCQLPLFPLDVCENQLIIDTLPLEVLAHVLSYTGIDLPRAILTCKRFYQAMETFIYMMKLIPVRVLSIRKDPYNAGFVWIGKEHEQHSDKEMIRCKIVDMMKYVRRLHPFYLSLEGSGDEVVSHLCHSWTKMIIRLDIIGKENLALLSAFPNEMGLIYEFIPPSSSGPLMEKICAALPCVYYLSLQNDSEENDASLNILIEKTNSTKQGIEFLGLYDSTFSSRAVINFLEKANFYNCPRFFMSAKLSDVESWNPENGAYESDTPGRELEKWIRLQQADEKLGVFVQSPYVVRRFDFYYRSTFFQLNFKY